MEMAGLREVGQWWRSGMLGFGSIALDGAYSRASGMAAWDAHVSKEERGGIDVHIGHECAD